MVIGFGHCKVAPNAIFRHVLGYIYYVQYLLRYFLFYCCISVNYAFCLSSPSIYSEKRFDNCYLGIFVFTAIYNHDHNILRLLIFHQILLSQQVKRSLIISNKHGIYEVPHEMLNGLRLWI